MTDGSRRSPPRPVTAGRRNYERPHWVVAQILVLLVLLAVALAYINPPPDVDPPKCKSCGAREWGHVCRGLSPGAALAAQGLSPALAGTKVRQIEKGLCIAKTLGGPQEDEPQSPARGGGKASSKLKSGRPLAKRSRSRPKR